MSTLIKLEKGPTDKAKESDPGGSDQQNLGFKIRNYTTVGLIERDQTLEPKGINESEEM